MNEKKCIYHYTHPIEENAIGSGVRPYMMLNAFKSIGYDVEEISGYGKERKKKIKELINKIKNGERYDFLYSESLTCLLYTSFGDIKLMFQTVISVIK